jgi:hypothetical protein
MPGFLLNSTAIVKCAHAGMAVPAATFPKVRVMGQEIVLLAAPYQIAGCAMPPPPAGNGPCVVGKFLAGSTKVMANGVPILLGDSIAACVPTGTPLVIAVTQTKVTGI